MSAVTSGQTAAAAEPAVRTMELSIGGMTCASCAARIEKKLSKLGGVTATVNIATETAQVSFPGTLAPVGAAWAVGERWVTQAGGDYLFGVAERRPPES